ncbi:MAG: hypothetical protein PHT69_00780 [Bacteroidales bacterium]|nr:hypothetical protein [Bacteroidales bacterium]
MLNELISHFDKLLYEAYGLDISKFDENFLLKSLQKRIEETNCLDENDYYELLIKKKKEAEIFYLSLNNSFTEFFRNSLTYAVLEHLIIPDLIQKKTALNRREIRVWSAACASGLEPYGIAILINENLDSETSKLNYRIFATDINEAQISIAREGQYQINALENINLKHLNKWFTKNNGLYKIDQLLKKHIEFTIFDLLSKQYSSPPSSIFGNFDIVICANVLFYYKEEYQDIIINKIEKSLAQDGYIVTGEAERYFLINKKFKEVVPMSGIFKS